VKTAKIVMGIVVWAGAVQAQSRPAPTARQTPAITPAGHAPTAHRRVKPPSASAGATASDDAALERRIRERLSRSKLGTDPIQVTVRQGVATFEGETRVIQRKGAATRIAHSAGAVRVENHIRLSEEARRAAAANLAKGRRRAQVVRGEPRGQR